MNTPLAPPLNDIYRHYLDVYFHPTTLDEPLLTRSELACVLALLPAPPADPHDSASWLALLSPAWLRGAPDAEPFPDHAEANRQWRAAQRTRQQEREGVVRKQT